MFFKLCPTIWGIRHYYIKLRSIYAERMSNTVKLIRLSEKSIIKGSDIVFFFPQTDKRKNRNINYQQNQGQSKKFKYYTNHCIMININELSQYPECWDEYCQNKDHNACDGIFKFHDIFRYQSMTFKIKRSHLKKSIYYQRYNINMIKPMLLTTFSRERMIGSGELKLKDLR